MDRTSREYFDSLRHKGQDEAARGELAQALATLEEATEWAGRYGGRAQVDQAYCNRSAILIHLGRGSEVIRDLQRLLLSSADPASRHLAAINVSIFYDLKEDFKRSRSYAEKALDYAQQTGSVVFQVRSFNRLANLLLSDSRFEEAQEYYQQALDLAVDLEAGEEFTERATLYCNLGYCHLLCGGVNETFHYLFNARRLTIRMGIKWGHLLARIRLSLSAAYLEIGRYHRARLHAIRGMQLAEDCNEAELSKKALYVLGEVEKLGDNSTAAYNHYSRLQNEYYPDLYFLPDTLMNTETRELVNLWA